MARRCSRAGWLALLALLVCGCSAQAQLVGQPPAPLPLPEGIRVAFNHNATSRYRSPINGQWRQGDDLEAFVLQGIADARQEILVAVQELTLPRIAEALVARQRQGVRVRVVLENTYSTPWSEQHPADLNARERHRQAQLQALGGADALVVLRRGGIPVIDDTANGSAGSGLMHHKFMVIDNREVITGSTNFTPSCVHGDPDDPRTRGNVNHLLRLASPELASLFREEFERMWGDGPGGAPDSRFGLGKTNGPIRWVKVGDVPVGVLFAPQRSREPHHGVNLLDELLAGARDRADLALFVFSSQQLGNRVSALHDRGVAIRLLVDPGFSNRYFSEVLDLLGMELPDHRCLVQGENQPRQSGIDGVGTPRLAAGDKLHHKFAVLDNRRVITGSFNWSPSAAHKNDETVLVIDSPLLAAHFRAEVDRLWKGAELGVSARLQRKRERLRQQCGGGSPMRS
jgi:phosphatidylserine/phosphatidylglycerophosphate/cardiolipin synthase-like enzyme